MVDCVGLKLFLTKSPNNDLFGLKVIRVFIQSGSYFVAPVQEFTFLLAAGGNDENNGVLYQVSITGSPAVIVHQDLVKSSDGNGIRLSFTLGSSGGLIISNYGNWGGYINILYFRTNLS